MLGQAQDGAAPATPADTKGSRTRKTKMTGLNNALAGNCGSRAPTNNAGWSSPVARQAHNLKVAGSNPAPATKYAKGRPKGRPLAYLDSGYKVEPLRAPEGGHKPDAEGQKNPNPANRTKKQPGPAPGFLLEGVADLNLTGPHQGGPKADATGQKTPNRANKTKK